MPTATLTYCVLIWLTPSAPSGKLELGHNGPPQNTALPQTVQTGVTAEIGGL